MTLLKCLISLPFLVFGLGVVPANAQLVVSFFESAPKDSFVIVNSGPCELADLELAIDLEGSAGGLIFDTEVDGAGINVAQPFELVQGQDFVRGHSEVADGARQLSLRFSVLKSGARVTFTIDLDDTDPARPLGQTRVSGSEIAGARLKAAAEHFGAVENVEGVFDTTATAELPITGCVS
jgi:hypothetical protein